MRFKVVPGEVQRAAVRTAMEREWRKCTDAVRRKYMEEGKRTQNLESERKREGDKAA